MSKELYQVVCYYNRTKELVKQFDALYKANDFVNNQVWINWKIKHQTLECTKLLK